VPNTDHRSCLGEDLLGRAWRNWHRIELQHRGRRQRRLPGPSRPDTVASRRISQSWVLFASPSRGSVQTRLLDSRLMGQVRGDARDASPRADRTGDRQAPELGSENHPATAFCRGPAPRLLALPGQAGKTLRSGSSTSLQKLAYDTYLFPSSPRKRGPRGKRSYVSSS
jgi:hypothetical protein